MPIGADAPCSIATDQTAHARSATDEGLIDGGHVPDL